MGAVCTGEVVRTVAGPSDPADLRGRARDPDECQRDGSDEQQRGKAFHVPLLRAGSAGVTHFRDTPSGRRETSLPLLEGLCCKKP